MSRLSLYFQFTSTTLYDPARKKEPSPTFQSEHDQCLEFFTKWSESDQVDFVEQLLSRMCHYQHGHINAYLKPMLQRDFISLLPSECCHCETQFNHAAPMSYNKLMPPLRMHILCQFCRKGTRSHRRKYTIVFRFRFTESCRISM